VGSVVRSAEGSAELESFVQSTSLDASAEKALRSESREVQMSVLSRGTLENCLNPSSAVMGRIHEARKELMHKVILERRGAAAGGADSDRGGSGADADLAVEVEQFIQENRLDETAARSFKIEAPQVQRAVLDRGSMHDCINPSAAVIGRMRDAKLSLAANAAAYTSASGTALVERVDIFIKENGLDDNAARCLRTELPVVQADVLERGSLADCVNASAAVMGRVRDAKGRRDDRRRDGPVGVGAGPPSVVRCRRLPRGGRVLRAREQPRRRRHAGAPRVPSGRAGRRARARLPDHHQEPQLRAHGPHQGCEARQEPVSAVLTSTSCCPACPLVSLLAVSVARSLVV